MKEPITYRGLDAAQFANLMAHPAASVIAFSALGLGMAGQAMGSWLGVVAGAAEASQRFWAPLTGGARDVAIPEAEAAAGTESSSNVIVLPKTRRADAARDRVAKTAVVSADKAPTPARMDDLKAIPGIGPKMEQVLNGLGVRSYAQIAAWSEEDVARIEDSIGFKGRVERDGWIDRAAALSGNTRTATGREA